jgi:hypothetical protein
MFTQLMVLMAAVVLSGLEAERTRDMVFVDIDAQSIFSLCQIDNKAASSSFNCGKTPLYIRNANQHHDCIQPRN